MHPAVLTRRDSGHMCFAESLSFFLFSLSSSAPSFAETIYGWLRPWLVFTPFLSPVLEETLGEKLLKNVRREYNIGVRTGVPTQTGYLSHGVWLSRCAVFSAKINFQRAESFLATLGALDHGFLWSSDAIIFCYRDSVPGHGCRFR